MFSNDQQPLRPTMRRKSSAQNLLSSFKSSSSSATSAAHQSLNLTPSLVSNATNLSFATTASSTSTTPTAPQAREWDAQSLHSDTVGSSMAGAQSPSLAPGTSVEYLRDLVQKRIITLTYIRQIHEGRGHWFHTIMISPADLDREFNNSMPAIKKRTSRFAVLGMSLSTLLDINQPQDLLRGLLNVITEFDLSKEEGENRSKMKLSKFKTKTSKKGALGIAEYTGSYVDGSADASFLLTPSIPFPLDYQQTLLSLLDVLSEVYNKIAKLLGPSPFHSAQQMMGPLGLLSPHPGVSYLFSSEGSPPSYGAAGQNVQSQSNTHHLSNSNLSQQQHQPQPFPSTFAGFSENEMGGSLWSIANGLSSSNNGSLIYSAGFSNSPMTNWMSSWDEMVLKIDGKLKKITSGLLKDLDALGRNGIKSELASLDPLLLGVGDDLPGPGQGNAVYEFEGI